MAMPEQKQGIDSWHLEQAGTMDDAGFQRWLDLLERRTGISLPKERRSFLVTSLAARIRELGLEDQQDYFDYLNRGVQGDLEWEQLVDRLTVHETRFMRDEHARSLLLHCLSNFQLSSDKDKSFTVWSAGCATGEEPYSLAMVIDDYRIRSGRSFEYHVLATDISLASLITAQRAIYPNNRGKNLTDDLRRAYTQAQGDSHFSVGKTLRDKVRFSQFNLLGLDKAVIPMMDVIVCQNVLIYFKQECRRSILDNMVRFLKPGGMLILGPGEVFNWKNPLVGHFEYPSTLAFKRLEQGENNNETVSP